MFLVSSAVRRCFALTDVEFLTLKNNCGIFIKNVIYICSEIEDLNVSNSGIHLHFQLRNVNYL